MMSFLIHALMLFALFFAFAAYAHKKGWMVEDDTPLDEEAHSRPYQDDGWDDPASDEYFRYN